MSEQHLTERWLPVVGWEGIYEVSNLGFVKRVKPPYRRKSGLIARTPNQYGRITVMLCDHPRAIRRQVHRLVMAAFVGPCPPGKEVNHINGNPRDNRLENLEYVTPSENQLHSYNVIGRTRIGNKGESAGRAKLTDEAVVEIRRLSASGVSYDKIRKDYPVHKSTIARIIRREIWTHI